MKTKFIAGCLLFISLFLSAFNFTNDNFKNLLKSIKVTDIKNIQVVSYRGDGTSITNFKIGDIKEFVKTLNNYVSYIKKTYPLPKGYPTFIKINMKNDNNSLELSRINGRLIFYMKDGTYGVEMSKEFYNLMERVIQYPSKFIPGKKTQTSGLPNNTIVPKLQDIDYVEYIKGFVGAGDVFKITYYFDLSNSYQRELISEMLNELKTAKTASSSNDYVSHAYSPPRLIIKLINNKYVNIQGPCAKINNIAYVSDGSKAICVTCPITRYFLDEGWKNAKLNQFNTSSQEINFIYKSIDMRVIPNTVKFLGNVYVIVGVTSKPTIDKEIGITTDNFRVFSMKNSTTDSAIAILGKESNPEIYLLATKQ